MVPLTISPFAAKDGSNLVIVKMPWSVVKARPLTMSPSNRISPSISNRVSPSAVANSKLPVRISASVSGADPSERLCSNTVASASSESSPVIVTLSSLPLIVIVNIACDSSPSASVSVYSNVSVRVSVPLSPTMSGWVSLSVY